MAFDRTKQIPEMWTTDELGNDPFSVLAKLKMSALAPVADTAGIIGALVKGGWGMTEPARDVIGDVIQGGGKILGDAVEGGGRFLKEDAGDMGRYISAPYYMQRYGMGDSLSDTETRLIRELDSKIGRTKEGRADMLKEKLFDEIYGDDPVDKSTIQLAPGLLTGKSHSISLANGGPVTLRRKMFSMGGGVDKSHGVGLTSGLTKTVPPQRGPMAQGYKTGGHVLPKGFVPGRVGYQPDWSPAKQGDREGHWGWLSLVPSLGITGLIQAGKAGAKHGAKKWLQYGSKNLNKIKQQQDDIAKQLKKFNDIKNKKKINTDGLTGTRLKEAIKLNKRIKERNALQASMSYGNVANALGIAKSGIMGQAGRAAGTLAGPAVAGASLGASAFGPEWYQREISDEDARWQKALKYIGKSYTDFSAPGAVVSGIDWLTGDGDLRGLSNIVAGITPEKVAEAAITHDTKPMEIASKMEQQEALRQEYNDKIELYKELLGAETKDNNLGTISDALMAAGTALTEGEGWTGAMSAGYDPLAAEVARRADVKDSTHQAAVQQAFADVTGEKAMIDEANINAVASGVYNMKDILQAQEIANQSGVPLIDQILDESGEIDDDKLTEAKGRIFFDPTSTAGGGMFVAINLDGVARSYNNLEDAVAHSKTTTA